MNGIQRVGAALAITALCTGSGVCGGIVGNKVAKKLNAGQYGNKPDAALTASNEASNGIKRLNNYTNAEAACLDVSAKCNDILKSKHAEGLSKEALDWMTLGCTNVYNACVNQMSKELDEATGIAKRL